MAEPFKLTVLAGTVIDWSGPAFAIGARFT
jgi:hypothetical protein